MTQVFRSLAFPLLISCLFLSCHPKTSSPPPSHASGPEHSDDVANPTEAVRDESGPRLSLDLLPGEYTLMPSPAGVAAGSFTEKEAHDALHNLAVAPEDLENGWHWAWDIFKNLPPEERSGFLDQAASLTPPWAWGRLDAILLEPAWGGEILQTLWRRLLDLPLGDQLPRILQIARNPHHPCREQANSLLQAYFPDVPSGNYEEYRGKIGVVPSPR